MPDGEQQRATCNLNLCSDFGSGFGFLSRKCTAVRYDCIYMHPISAPASGRVYVSVPPESPFATSLPLALSLSVRLYLSVCLCAHPKHTPTKEGRRHEAMVPKQRPHALRKTYHIWSFLKRGTTLNIFKYLVKYFKVIFLMLGVFII